jgi:hypothetical protein
MADDPVVHVRDVEAYYYGCQNDTGHYWFAKDGEWMGRKSIIAKLPESIGPYKVDGGFCPGAPKAHWGPSGHAAFHRVDGWSVLSFWDNSIEKRPGGCSTFVAKGTFHYATMREIAESQFPSVWKRFKFEIKLVEEHLG